MDVIQIIKQVLNISEEQITDDLSYQSIPEWDSLNHVSLIIALEKAFDVTIGEELLLKLTSVAAIRKFSQSLMEEIPSKKPIRDNNAIVSKNSKENTDTIPNISQQSKSDDNPLVFRGLNNIAFDNTTITNIDGKKGILEYRGYSINDLVSYSSFEEVAYLLLYKELPTKKQLENFDNQLKSNRSIPKPIADLIYSMSDADPILVLRTAISMLAHYDEDKQNNSIREIRNKGIRLIAQLPTIIAMHYRCRNKLPIVLPSSTLSHAANIFFMLKGEEPSSKQERIIDRNLIIHAEHSSNASTFTARVVIGTQADIYGAITSAIAAFSGPLHGGAIEHTMKMLREVKDPTLAQSYIQAKREKNEAIMGFGHRVYRTEDPRANHLRKTVIDLSQELQETKWINILDALVEAMRPYSQHGIHVNVDYYACVIYHLLGLPDYLFVPLFTFGRIAGWTAHVLEQLENNILIRPVMNYVGEKSRTYKAIELIS
ncbi:citrate/2-methylcitrate synthase [Clostridium botulinum]|uniref:citrate/2-methylcitrate synthase n=1 Tax=Clostridium botulinum TaxID=1491 RepID=UPI003DA541B8